MKTIKVIDLLNKIANGEEVPKKIKYQFKTFELNDSGVYLRTDKVKGNDYGIKTLLEYVLTCDLNDEVEVLEEDKEIEEINMEWFKQVDMFEPKSVELAIEMLAKQLNILSKAVNELKKGK